MSQHPVGFVLLTHDKPHQTKRLVTTLNQMFDSPPIVCHHNFSITPLAIDEMPTNVQFVQPHVKTGWGKFSTVEALLKALRLMYQSPDAPDWFVFLTGADYPIKPASVIVDELTSSPYDAFIHHEKVDYSNYKHGSQWQYLGFERYCIVRGWIPALDEKRRPKKLFFPILQRPAFTRFFIPFSESFPCYVGEAYFCANRKVAHYLLEIHDSNSDLAVYYRKNTIFPPESYFQTILCNDSELRCKNDCLRFIEWTTGTSHPKILDLGDLEKIQASPAHFARKLDLSQTPDLYDRLDDIVLGTSYSSADAVPNTTSC